jgi:hypothetical protein
LRRRGLCSLFLEGVPQYLLADLQRSGAAFLYGLRSARDDEKVTGDAGPFFDAVGCHDVGTARQIALVSRDTWNEQEEYEDDFLYVYFLMKKFFLNASEDEVRPLLQRFESLALTGGDPRFDICSSFMDGDYIRFEKAFEALIRNYDSYYRAGVNRDEILEEEWSTEGQFFTEGLAVLRLAAMSGFPIEDNYLYVPSIAIASRATNLDPDSWRTP